MSAYTIREETVGGVRRVIAQIDGELEITDSSGRQIATIAGASRSMTFPTAATFTPPAGSVGSSALAVPYVAVLSETHSAASFTDGLAAVGTKTMTGTIPAGAVLLGTKVLVPAGFAGDVSAALTIGDGSDADRYNTSTINVFTTAATGVQSGVPSGSLLVTTAHSPVLTVTASSDFTLVLAGGGSITVAIYYLVTV